jgi:hypothetical protein
MGQPFPPRPQIDNATADDNFIFVVPNLPASSDNLNVEFRHATCKI